MPCRPERWLLGAPSLAAILAVAVWQAEPDVEAALSASLAAPAAAANARALERLGIRVALDGRDLAVSGDAEPGEAARSEIERLRATLPGLRKVVVRIEPSRFESPFTFRVAKQEGALVLGGAVPPGPARAELNEVASNVAGRIAVHDGMRSAFGAAEGFAGAASALIRVVALLGQGAQASLQDRSLEVEGEAPDAGSYNAALALLRALPAGVAPTRVEIIPPLLRPYPWSASREGDRLVLRGQVPSETERGRLLESAKAAGLSPEDGMQTARGLPAGVDFGALADRAVGALKRLDSGTVSLVEGVLTVEGRGAARDLLPDVERDLRQWRHPGLELGRIAIVAVPASPYRFSAIRREGRVTLTGYAPDEPERKELTDLANRRFAYAGLASEIRLADGVPRGFMQAARLALERLSVLAEGEARLVDRTVQVSGRSPYPELVARMRREGQTGLPEGWTAKVEVVVGGGEKPLDARFCEDLLNDSARRAPIRFEAGRADLGAAATKALSGVADVLRRCGPVKVGVIAAPDAPGQEGARELAARRAGAVADALSRLETGAELRAAPQGAPASEPSRVPADTVGFEVRP